jgi:hypothetical protein
LLAGNLSHKEGALGEDAAVAIATANRWGLPQIGHDMKIITLQNGFRYVQGVLEALETSAAYQKQRDFARLSVANETSKQAGNRGYGSWWLSRLTWQYSGIWCEQRLEIHTHQTTYSSSSDGVKSANICSCGLVVEASAFASETATTDTEASDTAQSFLAANGHIRVSDQALQTLFVAKLAIAGERAKFCFYCQTCGVIGDAPIDDYRSDQPESNAILNELRRTHVCKS